MLHLISKALPQKKYPSLKMKKHYIAPYNLIWLTLDSVQKKGDEHWFKQTSCHIPELRSLLCRFVLTSPKS